MKFAYLSRKITRKECTYGKDRPILLDLRRRGSDRVIAVRLRVRKDASTDRVAVAQAAYEDAQRAGGGEYAPQSMTSSSEKLQVARNQVNQREYSSAGRIADEAEADAQLAKASAQAGKAKKAADEVQKSLQTLQQELSTSTGGSSTIK